MSEEKETFARAIEYLLFKRQGSYEPEAETRDDRPELTVLGSPTYNLEQNEMYLDSVGPDEAPYVLVFDFDEQTVGHAYGTYEDQQFPGTVTNIHFPED
ncbi:hypothetical protein [Haloterrigena alkaliphila]|uniref:Uncharacterized protein n=1 Tax=Haloterrigena alkaliphila TaxID=2816475 RepID=A0A8A2VQU5_9EURY|nr:hypothetical protein [Haloterrigena alkaliphila]QSX00459.1 hypothetical protein J0X25_05690 [Haloterrigena alkaliphila]